MCSSRNNGLFIDTSKIPIKKEEEEEDNNDKVGRRVNKHEKSKKVNQNMSKIAIIKNEDNQDIEDNDDEEYQLLTMKE